MTKIIDEEQKIDDMVFSEKGSQDGDINNDDQNQNIAENICKSSNDPRMSIFSMSKASTVDTNGRCNINNEPLPDESEFCFRSSSTVFKNYNPKDNRSNTVQNKLVQPLSDLLLSPRKSPPEEIDNLDLIEEMLLSPQKPKISN